MKSKEQGVGFGLAAVALAFLFNPNVSIVDLLPDFIGYLLLCFAFSRLSDLNGSIEAAVKGFRRMILIDGAKWITLLWVFGLSAPLERSSSLLLWSFVFAALEMVFLIPAWFKLFYGLTQLGYFHTNTAVFGSDRSKKSRTDKMRNLTVVFVGVKAILSVLPEFADLTNSSYDESSGTFGLYRYIGVMRMFAFLPVLIVGSVWLWKGIRYFCALRKDSAFVGELRQRYAAEILPKKGLFARRAVHLACFVFLTALCLTVDLRLEYRNIIPDTLAASTFFLVLYFFAKKLKIAMTPAWIACGVYWACASFSYGAEWRFFNEFTYSAIKRSNEARDAYIWVIVSNVMKAAAFLVLIWFVTAAFRRIVACHTGYVSGREGHGDGEIKMIQTLHKELNRDLTVAFAGASLYGAAELGYVLLAPSYGFAGALHLIFALLCIGGFVRALASLREAVDTKYMLE